MARQLGKQLLTMLPLGLIVGVLVGLLFGDPWFGLGIGAALAVGITALLGLLTVAHRPRR